MNRLFFYVSRFRDAIEADLAFRGVSLTHLWATRRWRKLLNLINHLPPNSYFNEALTNDKQTMMAMERLREDKAGSGEGDDRPVGPRVSQVSEEARRLGEVVSLVKWLGGVMIVASPKFKGGKISKVTPYPSPVMIDGKTGDWVGKPSQSKLRRNHEKRHKIALAAAERYEAARAKE